MTNSKNLASFMKAKMSEMDEHHLEPKERADLVNSFIFHALGLDDPKDVIEQPLYWDLLCYCFQMLSSHAIALGDEGFLGVIKALNSYMHSIHYSGAVGEDTFLGPEREEHERIWVERIEGLIEEEEEEELFPEPPSLDSLPLKTKVEIEKFRSQYENKPGEGK